MLLIHWREVSYLEVKISDELSEFWKESLLLFIVIGYKGNSVGRLTNLGFSVRYTKSYLDRTNFLKFENIV